MTSPNISRSVVRLGMGVFLVAAIEASSLFALQRLGNSPWLISGVTCYAHHSRRSAAPQQLGRVLRLKE
jgi:hypothetical protein